MKILVCVKQVPDLDGRLEIRDDKGWIDEQKIRTFRMNRFDEFAVEEALRIKEKVTGATVDAITVGPRRADEAVKRAMGMGADRGIHIIREEKGYQSPLVIAALLAEYARCKEYHLILAGIVSEDMMQGLVGPALAEQLALPCATAVVSAELTEDGEGIHTTRELEGGERESITMVLPAAITVQTGINTPRYPALSNILRAEKEGTEAIEDTLLRVEAPRDHAREVAFRRKSRSGTVLEGSRRDKASRLLEILRERALIQ